MKEQDKYDQMPLGLCDWVQCILPLAKKVADEIISDETESLKLGPDHHLLVVSEQATSPLETAKSGRSCPLGGTSAGLRAYAWLLPVGCYRHWEQQRLQSRQALVG